MGIHTDQEVNGLAGRDQVDRANHDLDGALFVSTREVQGRRYHGRLCWLTDQLSRRSTLARSTAPGKDQCQTDQDQRAGHRVIVSIGWLSKRSALRVSLNKIKDMTAMPDRFIPRPISKRATRYCARKVAAAASPRIGSTSIT